MTEVLNCITILVDSARAYQTSLDDRGLPEAFADFQKHSYNFVNAYTSAPSTVMALSGMFTGIPAVFNSVDYKTFNLEKIKTPILTEILKVNGINIFGNIYYPEGRYIFRNLFPPIKNKFLSKSFKNKVWGNEYIADIFVKAVSNNFFKNKKNFIFLHLNVRYAEKHLNNKINSSNAINRILYTIRNSHFYSNSVIIMCSDHGYPNPIINKGYLKNGHDLIMDDDNIKIPFSIKYSGQCRDKTFYRLVQNIDYFPTILDLFNIPHSGEYYHHIRHLYPQSLLETINGNIINNSNRIIRIDNRFWGQPAKAKVYINNNNTIRSKLTGKSYQWEKQPDKSIIDFDLTIESFLNNIVLKKTTAFINENKRKKIYWVDKCKNNDLNYFRSQLEVTFPNLKELITQSSKIRFTGTCIVVINFEKQSQFISFLYIIFSISPKYLIIDSNGRSIVSLVKYAFSRKLSKIMFKHYSSVA